MTDPQREREIFEAALDAESAEAREAFLQNACGGDNALLERVRALLRACASSSDFLPGTPASRPSHPETPVPGPGNRIDRYHLVEPLGEGGFGVVYLAEQLEPVRREVALKVIKPGMDSRQVIARFESERQALARMDHPHIAKVHDAGTTAQGHPYFVMERVHGTAITRFCREHNTAIPDRLRLFIDVCSAVEHAHQKGVIHRDLKPSNILVTVQDEVPRPRIIDFGIAKATGETLADHTAVTHPHQFVGTPAYMSPEQAMAGGTDIDTRSDIYSLGVLLYELLTGAPPFDTQELLSAGPDAMRRIICEKDPLRPSTRFQRSRSKKHSPSSIPSQGDAHASPFSSDLDWIVMKALEKDRARRYPTAGDFARDVARYLAHEPVLARPASHLYRLLKFTRRNRTLVAGLVSLVTLVLAALAVTSTLAYRLHQSRQQVAAEAEANAAMLGFFTQDLIALGAANPSAARETRLHEAVARSAHTLQDRFPDRPDIERRIRIELGRIFRALGDPVQALKQFRIALDISGPADNAGASKDRITLLKDIALVAFEVQDYAFAVECIREARAIAPESITPGSRLDVWLQMADPFFDGWTDPERLTDHMHAALNSVDTPFHVDTVQSRLVQLIPTMEAEFERYESALAGLERLLGDADGQWLPVTSTNRHLVTSLARVRSALKDPEGAGALIDQVLDQRRRETPPPPPSQSLLHAQGVILTEAGDLVAGEEFLRRALEIPPAQGHERTHAHQQVWSLTPLAWNLAAQGRFADADRILTQAADLASTSELWQADEPRVVRTAAAVAAARGRWREALDLCRQDILHHPSPARSLVLLAHLGQEAEFFDDRRIHLQGAAGTTDRLVLSTLLRAAAVHAAIIPDPFPEVVPNLANALESRLESSAPAMADEILLALASAARLSGDTPGMRGWAGRVSDSDVLLHVQAILLDGLALRASEGIPQARNALAAVVTRLPLLAQSEPDLSGSRWFDLLLCRLLHAELRDGPGSDEPTHNAAPDRTRP